METPISVMVADGNNEFAMILENEIRMEPGFRLAGSARDGITAIRMLEWVNPQILIIDNILKEIDGFSVIRRAKLLDSIPSVIVVSSFANRHTLAEVKALDVDYYMEKPLEIGCLMKRLRSYRDSGVYAYLDTAADRQYAQRSRHILSILMRLGIPANIKGWALLKMSVEMAIKFPDSLYSVTKLLYPEIARMKNTTSGCVERNIRFAVEAAWRRCDESVKAHYFGYTGEKPPSNSEFIGALAARVIDVTYEISGGIAK